MTLETRVRTYKPSDHAWAGDLPVEWSFARLRWLSRRYAGGTPDKTNEDFWTNGTIPWLNSGAVNQSTITEPSSFITEDAYNSSSAKWVPNGALVMALAGQGKTKGMVAHLAISATCNQSMAAILPYDVLTSRFLFWWLTTNYRNIRNLAGGDDRDGLNLELIGDIAVPVPPLPEQAAISAFLDHETAKIDELVEEQKRLIELLKEKRQAVVSHAVTKGLNPDAKMKDSGIEWLGEVPEHWEVAPIKTLATLSGRIGYRGYTTADIVSEGEGAITLSPSNLINGKVVFENCTFISWEKYKESPEIQLSSGDVVMVKTGSSFGKVGIARDNPIPPTTINPQLIIFKDVQCSPDFLFYALGAPHVKASIEVSNTGGTIPTMTQESIGNFRVALPSSDEQTEIVTYLNKYSNALGELIEQADTAISLLQERRAALISAAVTGKVDVPEAAEPRGEAA